MLVTVSGLHCPVYCAELGPAWGFPLLDVDSHHSRFVLVRVLLSYSPEPSRLYQVFAPQSLGPQNKSTTLNEPTRIRGTKSRPVRNFRETQEKAFKHIMAP